MDNPAARRIEKLREQMAERGIDAYIIPNTDFHDSEYISPHFCLVQYFTGFTGSSATAVILREEACLWTDGRYFIQAGRQLLGSGIFLQRSGEEGTPSIEAFLWERLPEGGCIGFDARTVNAAKAGEYQKIAEEKHGFLFVQEDLAGDLWENRPKLPSARFFVLEHHFCGRTAKEKLSAIRKKMDEYGANVHLLSSLCGIAWILNIRSADACHVPVVLSYLAISRTECIWFLQEEMITDAQRAYLTEHEIATRPYEAIYDYAASLAGETVLYDPKKINYRIEQSLPDDAARIHKENPDEHFRAVKNPVEQQNIRAAHSKDGVAVTKFLYWLKTRIGKEPMTECTASARLEEQRRAQEHYFGPSFGTICAYGANAAMMHYEAVPECCADLAPEGFLLVDCGGHYLEGTTDITRTVALGPLTKQMKSHFTAVLRANLNLAAVKFLYGCRGSHLDILAREPLWRMGMDYRCGTGHGVGYLLNVHEGPNAFRFLRGGISDNTAVFEEGMVTTDEPGIYIENEYGIRIENELLCKKAEKNEYGQFMEFETITYAPVDLDAVAADEMTDRERELLNAYHKKTYEMISPFLTDEEKAWLKEYTREI